MIIYIKCKKYVKLISVVCKQFVFTRNVDKMCSQKKIKQNSATR